MRVLVEPMWGSRRGLDPAPAGRRPDPGRRDPLASATRGSAASTRSPSRPTSTRRCGILAGGGYDLGLLLDGDADRAGAADEQGTFIHQLQVMGLLMYYLLEHRGLRQPVVSTINETSHGRPPRRELRRAGVTRRRSASSTSGPKMIETGAMMGGEESGGYGFGMHLPERDGIYADLLLLDLFIREREAGRWPVSTAVAAPPRRSPARRSTCARTSTSIARPIRRSRSGCWSSWASRRPRRSPASRSCATDALTTNDGFKFWLDDGSWLLVRFSGTEPLVRVYAEATSAELRDALLAEGGDGGLRDAAARVDGAAGSTAWHANDDARRSTATRRPSVATPRHASALDPSAGPRCAGWIRRSSRLWRISADELTAAAPGGRRARHGRLRHRRRPGARHLPTGCACRWRSVRGYDLPAWVDGETLVVASSYSGATEETISAFTAGARARGCPVAVITTGGPLGDVAAARDLPLVDVPGRGPPRAAVGYSMALLAGLLERAGMLPLDEAEIAAASRPRRDDGGAAAARTCRPSTTRPSSSRGRSSTGCRHRGERLPGAGRATLEDAAQRERQASAAVGGAARGDAQHGRRLRAAGRRCATTCYVVFLASRPTTRATRCARTLSRELLTSAGIAPPGRARRR